MNRVRLFASPVKFVGPVAVLLLTIMAYWPSMAAPFVFDDQITITRNIDVQTGASLIPHSLLHRKLLAATFAWNFWLDGANTRGFHAVNVAAHCLNAVLVYLIIARFALGQLAAVAGMAVFALHPLQTESVAYISSRSELLAATCALVGLAAFVWGFTVLPRCALLIILMATVVGFGFKETVIALPLLIVAFVVWGVRLSRLALAGLAATAIGGGCFVAYLLRGTLLAADVPYYYAVQGWIFWRHVGQLVWPVLSIDWQVTISSTQAAGAWLCLVLAGWCAWRIAKAEPLAGLGFMVLLTLLVPRSLFPVPDLMVEHRMYIPMLGVAVLVACCVNLFERKIVYG